MQPEAIEAPAGEWLSPAEWEMRATAAREGLASPPEAEAWREALTALQLRDNGGYFWAYDGTAWRRFEANAWSEAIPPEWLSPQLTALILAPAVPPPEPEPAATEKGPEIDPEVMQAVVEASGLISAATASAVETEVCPECGGELPEGLIECLLCGHELCPYEPEPATSAVTAAVAAGPGDEQPQGVAAMMTCPSCGAQTPASGRFCRGCGQPVVLAEQGPAPVTAVVSTVEAAVAPVSLVAPAGWACPRCATTNMATARFCRACGGPGVAEDARCASCGSRLLSGARFCRTCGTAAGAAS